ncbi:MAG TPA: hypothetical protein VJL57_03475 [Candidatus Paceibacterota bacterium]
MNDTNEPMIVAARAATSPSYDQLRQQYAEICAFGVRSEQYASRYASALEDFDALCKLPCVQVVGIDPAKQEMYIGTTRAILRKTEFDPWREIGEFIVTIGKTPSQFTCANITRNVDGNHHPHVNSSGFMCINNRMEILCLITDGDVLEAFRIIWAGLNTTNNTPYSDSTKWPLHEETSK